MPSKARRRPAFGLIAAAAGLLLGANAQAQALKLEGAAILMRHGVRPPTKAQPMPEALARDPWPAWPVAPGELTPHGARAIGRLAAHDRALYARAGLAPARGCPAPGAIAIWADVDQRTIATGQAWAQGFAPGCGIATGHAAGRDDLLFSPFAAARPPLAPETGLAAVRAALPPGGLAAVHAAQRPRLERLSRILGCCAAGACARYEAPAPCGLADMPTGLAVNASGRPRLTGGLDLASTAAQILLLQYAEGKPAGEVGWGRASAADIADLSALHALEFEILARPPAMARANAGPIAERLLASLQRAGQAGAPKLLILMGHDTNVASLGGLLGLHWQVAGYASDDPAPGGQLGFEWLRAADGRVYVRAFYQAQPLAQIRSLSAAPPTRLVLRIPGCASGPEATCPLPQFADLVRRPAPRD